ncbi:MAG TPA: hypothetical protein VFS33_03495 [Gemmatimonadales bacterium]|nr:hypothetical protein [Gemmatimonadales bacterium]
MADQPLDPIPVPDPYNRRPTIDDMDDVDDEDGAVMEEQQQDNDLTLHPVNPSEITGSGNPLAEEDDTLRREDKGAVNVDAEDLGDDKVHL